MGWDSSKEAQMGKGLEEVKNSHKEKTVSPYLLNSPTYLSLLIPSQFAKVSYSLSFSSHLNFQQLSCRSGKMYWNQMRNRQITHRSAAATLWVSDSASWNLCNYQGKFPEDRLLQLAGRSLWIPSVITPGITQVLAWVAHTEKQPNITWIVHYMQLGQNILNAVAVLRKKKKKGLET